MRAIRSQLRTGAGTQRLLFRTWVLYAGQLPGKVAAQIR